MELELELMSLRPQQGQEEKGRKDTERVGNREGENERKKDVKKERKKQGNEA